MGYLLFLSFQEPSKQCVNTVSQGSCPGFFLHHPASQDCSHFKKLCIHCILSIFTYIVMYPLHALAYGSLHPLAVLLLPLLNDLMKIIDQMKERRGGDRCSYRYILFCKTRFSVSSLTRKMLGFNWEEWATSAGYFRGI